MVNGENLEHFFTAPNVVGFEALTKLLGVKICALCGEDELIFITR